MTISVFSVEVPDDTMTISVLVWRYRMIQWRSLFLVWRSRTEPRLLVWPVRPSGPAALTSATGTPSKPNETERNQTKQIQTKPNQINHRNLSWPANNHANLSRLRIVMSDKTYIVQHFGSVYSTVHTTQFSEGKVRRSGKTFAFYSKSAKVHCSLFKAARKYMNKSGEILKIHDLHIFRRVPSIHCWPP